MTPVFFPQQSDFRKWLTKNHKKESELVVGFYKVNSGKPSITWSQSVDEALCFGWIDGVRRTIDEDSYSIRFTPRRPTSIWSAININKVEQLTKQGLMKPAGLAIFKLRKEEKSNVYSHEKETAQLPGELKTIFKKNKRAWDYFNNQAPSYKKVIIHWITTAKQKETQLRRLNKVMAESEQHKRVI